MAVSTTQDGYLVRMSGTISEVLTEIQDQKLTKVIWWTDDDTDAICLCSRLKF